MAAFEQAMERIVGLPSGSFTLIDRSALDVWLDRTALIEER
jgi:3-hydroxyacyl-CoA dehydrogenase